MTQQILSVGIDVGTTTTQVIFSRLTLENEASGFAVPRIQIAEKTVFYQSAVHFTPLLSERVIDAQALRELVAAEYRAAGVRREAVQTGAVLITGETARRENASAVLHSLAGFAGDFVVATAGPQLESILAGKGAGAQKRSEALGTTVVNLDIGGGTTNLACFTCGALRDCGCLNVGGRLVCYDAARKITYVSPVLRDRVGLSVGDTATQDALRAVAAMLAGVVLQALGFLPKDAEFSHFITDKTIEIPPKDAAFSFSGGVGALLDAPQADWTAYGDLGVLLAQEILRRLPPETRRLACPDAIRATVIGAGCHTTELSGSTVFYRGVTFPLQNLPAVFLTNETLSLPPPALHATLAARQAQYDTPCAVAFPGLKSPSYPALRQLADALAPTLRADRPNVFVMREDMAKALGQALSVRRRDAPLLCLDSIFLPPDAYLDVGAPVAGGQALPVIVKTLIL